MRKLSKKISMLMVLAMLVSLFSGIVSASAASAWSFKSSKYDVAVGETIEMEKNEYADFDLFKENAAAPSYYTVKWSSSDSDAVWVNAKTGQLRADKFKTADYGDKATISATFTNTNTGKSATRSFVIVVAEKAEYTLSTMVGDVALGAETLAVGTEYALTSTVTADGKAVEATVAYTVNGATVTALKFDAEGEYTVVATATIDGKVVTTKPYEVIVKVTEVAIEKVYQKDLDTLCVVFNDAAYAKKAADASVLDIEKVFELTFNADKEDGKGGDRVDHELFKAAVSKTDATVVEIDAYKPLEENFTYKIAYLEDGKEVAYNWIVGSGKIPFSLDVVDNAEVIVETETKMGYVVKNNKGVEITSWVDYDLYPLEWKIVEEDDTDSYVDVNEGTIYFFEKNKSTTVGLVLDMGYDDNGEVADLEAKGVFTSVDKTAAERPTAYAILSGNPAADAGWIGWNTSFDLYVGEGQGDVLDLYAKYTKKAADGKESTMYIVGGLDGDDNEYTYQSSNTDIVAIDEEVGIVYPVAVGTAKLYIKKDGIVIGFATVRVHDKAVFTKFDVTPDTTKLSVIGDGYQIDQQKINLSVVLQDKLGRNIPAEDVDFEWEVLTPNKIVSIDGAKTEFELDEVFDWNGFATDAADNKVKGVIMADQDGPLAVGAGEVLVKDKDTKSFRVKFTAIYTNADGSETELTDTVSFTVKNTTGVENVTTNLEIPSFNTYLGTVDMLNVGKYTGNIKAVQKDGQDYYIDTVAIDELILDPDEEVAVTEGYVTLVISKDNKELDTDKAPKFTNNTYSVAVASVWYGDDDNELIKAETGNYKVQLFEGTGDKARRIKFANMSVTDNGPAYSVIKLKEWIDDYDAISELGDAVEFRLGDGKVELDSNIVPVVEYDIDYNRSDTNRVYIYKYELKINISKLINKLSYGGKAWEGDANDYFMVPIKFNKTFTLK